MRLTAMASFVVVAGFVVACGARPAKGPGQTTGSTESKVVDWSDVGATAKVGDLDIEALWASPQRISGDRNGEHVNYGVMTVIKLRFRNRSETKLVRFGGWLGGEDATDEHGNKYKAVSLPRGFWFGIRPYISAARDKEEDAGCDTEMITAGREVFHPGKCYTRFLLHEEPVAAAEEIRLTVDAKEVGGVGALRFRVPIVKQKAD